MDDTDDLTETQRKYVEGLALGLDSRAAARLASYSESFSKVASHRLAKKPAVVRAIAAAHAALREKTLFTQEQAVREIDAQIAIALSAKNPNHMAAANLLQLKCKIHGLVKDKIEIERTDIKGSLLEARVRVFGGFCPHCPHCQESAMHMQALPSPKVLTDAQPVTVSAPPNGEKRRDLLSD